MYIMTFRERFIELIPNKILVMTFKTWPKPIQIVQDGQQAKDTKMLNTCVLQSKEIGD